MQRQCTRRGDCFPAAKVPHSDAPNSAHAGGIGSCSSTCALEPNVREGFPIYRLQAKSVQDTRVKRRVLTKTIGSEHVILELAIRNKLFKYGACIKQISSEQSYDHFTLVT